MLLLTSKVITFLCSPVHPVYMRPPKVKVLPPGSTNSPGKTTRLKLLSVIRHNGLDPSVTSFMACLILHIILYNQIPRLMSRVSVFGATVCAGAADAGVTDAQSWQEGYFGLGAAAFGFGSAEADNNVGIYYQSQAPAGVTSTLQISGSVLVSDLSEGANAAGAGCAGLYGNAVAGPQVQTQTLAPCLSFEDFTVGVPFDASDIADVFAEDLSKFSQQLVNAAKYAQETYEKLDDVNSAVQAWTSDHGGNSYTASFSFTLEVCVGVQFTFF